MNSNSNQPNIQDVLSRLHGVKQRSPNEWMALCPAHDDRNPSLSVKDDDGKPLLYCFACKAPYSDILAALGFSLNGRPPAPQNTTYDYRDAQGNLIYQVVRTVKPDGKKGFFQQRPDGSGGWIKNLKGVTRLLYRLPQLLNLADFDQPVYICEGEKDADRLAGLGLVATCNSEGAGKWGKGDYNEYLAGRVVYVLADNDKQGRDHAENVARNLAPLAQSVRVVNLPGLPDKGDVSDWLNAGHTKDDLERECAMSPLWGPVEPPQTAPGSKIAGFPTEPTRTDDPTAAPLDPDHKYGLEDTGNAERFAARYRDNVRYDHQAGKWLVWAGSHWQPDTDGAAQRLAKNTARAIYDEAATAAGKGDDDGAAAIGKWAKISSGEARRNAMLNLARSERPLAITHDQLNRDNNLLNCQNGTLNLATGKLYPHDRGDLLTYVLPVEYDPAAPAPTWDAFIDRITGGDRELAAFLARAVGYTLGGDAGEQCLFFLYGFGANGKSTFIEIVMALLGDLGHKARAQVLMASERDRIPNEIAALAGKRLVVSSELSDGARLNEGLIKDLTGGDSMSARFLHQEAFTFRPAFRLWIYGNHKPVIAGTDDGIWRRIRLIPFSVQIPENERDPGLPGKLRAELAGVLAWAVRGRQDYQRQGLNPPQVVTDATKEYRGDSDTLGLFIDDRCITGPHFTATAGDLYATYTTWAEANGLRAVSNVRFGRSLAERGLIKDRDGVGRWYYRGIGITP